MKQLILVLFLFSVLSFPVIADTILVPEDYDHIQTAVNNASEGDTILVASGTYSESIDIDVPVIIIGQDMENTIVQWFTENEAIVTINGVDHVTIKNLTVQSYEISDNTFGIELISSNYCAIEHCRFTSCNTGIRFSGISFSTISCCLFTEVSYGINMIQGYMGNYNLSNCIDNNIFENVESTAINFQHTISYYHQSNFIRGNLFCNNGAGIISIVFNENYISGNHFINNEIVAFRHDLCMGGGQNNFIYHNNFMLGENGSNLALAYGENQWCSYETEEGNHWSDYGGVDVNGDGIGDTGYIINNYNSDYFPFMERLYSSISGYITNSENEEIEGATITVIGTSVSVTSDMTGYYSINNLDAGFCGLSVTSPGYLETVEETVPLTLGENTELNIMITGDGSVPPEEHVIIARFILRQNYPNPFNSSTKIEFDLQNSAYLLLEIFDINGRKVNTLVNGIVSAGSHQLNWDGKDMNGKDLSSGLYFYSLSTEGQVQTRKMVIVK